jgi:hypothetical protein
LYLAFGVVTVALVIYTKYMYRSISVLFSPRGTCPKPSRKRVGR